jgi:hypothetical protein
MGMPIRHPEPEVEDGYVRLRQAALSILDLRVQVAPAKERNPAIRRDVALFPDFDECFHIYIYQRGAKTFNGFRK